MTNREIDALVAEHVMGWTRVILGWLVAEGDARDDGSWCPSTSPTDASAMEAKIGEGFADSYKPVYDYLKALHEITRSGLDFDASFDADWCILRATPRQRCLAALRAVAVDLSDGVWVHQ